ncbi:uncharacterized [Tachysurus ichikawai]
MQLSPKSFHTPVLNPGVEVGDPAVCMAFSLLEHRISLGLHLRHRSHTTQSIIEHSVNSDTRSESNLICDDVSQAEVEF